MNQKLLQTLRYYGWGWLFIAVLIRPALSQIPEYSLQEYQTAHQTIVSIYETKTKHSVWKHKFQCIGGTYPDNGSFFWSHDRRAVAFSTESDIAAKKVPPSERISLVVWRAGKKSHVIPIHPLKSEGFEYMEDMVWSPNNDCLLVRLGGSGMGDGDDGWVQCFDLKRHQAYFLGDSVGRPHWVNATLVQFWPEWSIRNVAKQGDKPTSQLWRVPKA